MIYPPSPWITRHAPLIRKGGLILDLACGNGRHAIWLAKQGYQVEAVDWNAQAVGEMLGMSNISVTITDIEAEKWPASDQRYDGIVVSRYLYRPLLGTLAQMLQPDGVLIYETFMLGNERYGKPSNPDYLLLQDELLSFYGSLLTINAFEQGIEHHPKPAVMQRICATKNT